MYNMVGEKVMPIITQLEVLVQEQSIMGNPQNYAKKQTIGGGNPPQPFAALFPDVDAAALGLLDQMLQFNPARRISVEAALAHPFMAPLHVESDEPEAAFTCSFDFEHQDLSKATLQQLITAPASLLFPRFLLSRLQGAVMKNSIPPAKRMKIKNLAHDAKRRRGRKQATERTPLHRVPKS